MAMTKVMNHSMCNFEMYNEYFSLEKSNDYGFD